jgi:hypothetical protein
VGLVLGQHDRAVGQVAEVLVQGGEGLVAVGVALGDQGGCARRRPYGPAGAGSASRWRAGPAAATAGRWSRPWVGEQPQDPLGLLGTAQLWSAAAAPVGQGGGAVAL